MNKNIMKRVWVLTTAIALMVFAWSCDDNFEPTPQFKGSDTQFAATASATSVEVTAADSLDNVLTFNWNDPGYAVGLANTKFSIIVGKKGENFSRFFSKDFTGVLSGSLLGKEVNAFALKLGAPIDDPFLMEAKVVATQENNNEPKSSAVVDVSVTAYSDLVITPSVDEVVLTPQTAGQTAVEFDWTTAFAGYDGVKTYQLQYAKGGTSFANPTSVDVTTLTKSFTVFELNKIALANGLAPDVEGTLDFRIKATTEAGNAAFSPAATITVTPYLAFNAIGIIGDATANGSNWSIDTDMYRPDPTKPVEWTLTTYLVGGKKMKFRSDDSWDTNWGANAFPSGTATQGGPDIPIPTSGYYKIDFNPASGAYTITAKTTTDYNFVSLIGSQSGWGPDIADLTQDATDDQIWTGTVNLIVGELKFRANHDWGTNWGPAGSSAVAAISGFGVQNGQNISITEAGNYFVYINVASGEFFFGKADRATAYADVGIIGDATPGGWGADTDFIRNPANPYKWSKKMALGDGEAKFRANNDWGVNWGANTFPAGVGTAGGPNIPLDPGTYFITFNSATGEYTFSQ